MNFEHFNNDSPESFYWAGFIAADGCVGNLKCHNGKYSYRYLSIHLSDADIDHLKKFKKFIGCSANISHYNKQCKLTIISDSLVNSLKRFNIIDRKTHIYRFPDFICDHKYCNHFMRGYFDGDGCFSSQLMKKAKKSQFRFSLLGTKNFLKVYQDILINKCEIKTNRKILKAKGTYLLQYGGNKILSSVTKYLYSGAKSSIWLERKRDKSLTFCQK